MLLLLRLLHHCQRGVGGDAHAVQLRLLQPLCLGPAVLEPDLDLRLAQLQLIGEVCPLRDGQVLLLLVLVLEGLQLLGGERCALLAVGLVLAKVAAERQLRREDRERRSRLMQKAIWKG